MKYERWGCPLWDPCISGTTRIFAKLILQKHDPNCDLSSDTKIVYFLEGCRLKHPPPPSNIAFFYDLFLPNSASHPASRMVGKLKSIAFRRTYAQVYSVPVCGGYQVQLKTRSFKTKTEKKYWAKNKNTETKFPFEGTFIIALRCIALPILMFSAFVFVLMVEAQQQVWVWWKTDTTSRRSRPQEKCKSERRERN